MADEVQLPPVVTRTSISSFYFVTDNGETSDGAPVKILTVQIGGHAIDLVWALDKAFDVGSFFTAPHPKAPKPPDPNLVSERFRATAEVLRAGNDPQNPPQDSS